MSLAMPVRAGARFAPLILVLAAIPPLLVFFDRWLNNGDLANYLRDVWCKSPALCDLVWRPYFVFIWVVTIAVIVLVKLCGVERIERVVSYPESQDAAQPSVAQRRFGVMLIVAGVLGVAITIVRLILSPGLPGWDYVLICVLYVSGWFLYTTPRAHVLNLFAARWLRWLVYALGLAAVSWLLFSYYGRNHLSVFSLLLGGFALLVLLWMRRELNPSYWLVLLALVVFTLFLNAWNFVIIGDEYAFYDTGRGIAFDTSLFDIGKSIFDGTKVYGSHPYLSSVLMAPSFRFFDTFNFGWRYASIFASAVSVFFFYYFFRAFLASWVAFVAAFLIAVSHYLMAFSRIGYNNTQSLLALGLTLAAATWAIKTQRRFAFVTMGLALSFCLYTFPAALFVLPVAIWLLLIYYPPRSRVAITNWAITLGTWFVFLVPLLFQPTYWSTKIEQGSVLYRAGQIPNTQALIARFITQFGYSFYSFLFIPSESHYVRMSYVDGITGAFVLVGLAVILWRVRADKFAFFTLTGFAMLLFLVGATHGTNYPPNTRMFLLVPWFCLIAAVGLQWLVSRFPAIVQHPLRARVLLGAFLAAVLALNLYQAYDTSVRPPGGFLEFDALFVHLGQNLAVDAHGAARSIVFVYDPSRHDIPSLQREFDLVYTPVTLVGQDITRRQPASLTGQLRPGKNIVALSPQLESSVQTAYVDVLTQNRWVECPVRSVLGPKRISVWYAPQSPDPCLTPPSGLPLVLPDATSLFLIALAFVAGLAGLVYLERHSFTPGVFASGAVGALLPSAFRTSLRFNRTDIASVSGAEPRARGVPAAATPPQKRGFTLELNIRFTFSRPEDDAISQSASHPIPITASENDAVSQSDSNPIPITASDNGKTQKPSESQDSTSDPLDAGRGEGL